jgi:Tol biopolymer transport system component
MKLRLITIATLAGLALAAPAADASFAGQNGRIYFATSKQGQGKGDDIYSITARGTKLRRVTDQRGYQREPAVSPDAREIAFWSFRGVNSGLWLTDASGSAPGVLADGNTNNQAAFTADGDTVAFRRHVPGPGEHIFTVPVAGGSPTPLLAETDERFRWPTFSADGELMAYVRADANGPRRWNVYVADADGTDPVRVTSLRGDEFAPDFAPNGNRIVFQSRARSGEADIYSVRTDGTGLRRLTPRDGVSEWMPDYSPDGKRIVYMRELGGNPDLFTMNANGSHRKALTHMKRTAQHPDWATKPAG